MRNRVHLSSLLLLSLVLMGMATTLPVSAQQQPIMVSPHELYRFRISNTDLGYILTHNYQEGVNLGFTFDGIVGSIYPVPAPGYTPDPSSGLFPLHRWTVTESGWRVYTYHSIYFFNHGSNYRYDGIRGYLYPPAASTASYSTGPSTSLNKMSLWYSQRYGFWYGRGEVGSSSGFEFPPNSSFANQGAIASMPPPTLGTRPDFCANFNPLCLFGSTSFRVQFNPPPPPPPPPTCDPNDEQFCWNNSGMWDPNTCFCDFRQQDPCYPNFCSF